MAEVAQLYGGAITANLPEGFVDASMFREIPDTQEVYVSQSVDDSVVIDLMESVEETGDAAVDVHLKEIAEMNGAADANEYSRLHSEQITLSQLPQTPSAAPVTCLITIAIEPARKWGRSAQLEGDQSLESPLLAMVLSVTRLENVSTDLVVTYNVPITSRDDYSKLLTGVPESLPERVQAGLTSVKAIMLSLQVKDWSLFG